VKKSSAIRACLAVLVTALLAYAGAAIWLMTQETRLVFQADRPLGQARPAAPFEQIDIARGDHLRQFAWVMPASDEAAADAPWALFLHGNSATIASRGNIAHYERLRALGLNVLAPEYRGFGGLEGVPSEASVYADARAAYDHLRAVGVAPDRILVYGWSLGGAVAVDLASQVPHAGLVLEGAPASLVAIGQAQYPLFPIGLLMRNPFHAIEKVRRIPSPILFIHSPEDAIVPIAEGRRLFEAATAKKRFVEVRGGHVNALDTDPEVFVAAIRALLTEAHVRVATHAPVMAR
jgi:hypothetical protein